MLTDDVKDSIKVAYNKLIESKSLLPRWGQRQMIAEIARSLARIPATDAEPATEPAICVVEAGTGTGKTIAYSVAAIPMAQALGKRLIVATATVALQEQFIGKDLPDIKHCSGLDFSYALAKGRRRYVCLSKLDRLLSAEQGMTVPLYPDEFAVGASAQASQTYNAMIDALGRGEWDGDRDNWRGLLPDDVWFAVTTDHSQCSGRRCSNISQCSFFKAREELGSADVIVSNHDLVLADLALGGGAILPDPEDSIYIFDEGHHLPAKALSHFAGFCRLHTTVQWLQESKKLLAQGAALLAALPEIERPLQNIPTVVDELSDNLEQAQQVITTLFLGEGVTAGRDEQQLRFEQGLVAEELVPVAKVLAASFDRLEAALSRINSALDKAVQGDVSGITVDDAETWHIHTGGMLGRAKAVTTLWRDYAHGTANPDFPVARWIVERGSGDAISYDVQSSPVLASDILRECLWSRAAGVVVTSATMTALNKFDRFILHSGVPVGANFKVVPSPFDYANASFCVPAMDCEPSDAEAHTMAILDHLPQLVAAKEGTLVLFSSRKQMLDVYQGLAPALKDNVLMQGDNSKQELLRLHREAIDAGATSVLFGLASFAEGVDLPGDYCRHVIIAKIPFAVPDSPLEAALVEWVEQQGRNAFMEVSVPDAALRLLQASGRLLRTEHDTGRVTLMDTRILSRRYGSAILDSLPPFKRVLGKSSAG